MKTRPAAAVALACLAAALWTPPAAASTQEPNAQEQYFIYILNRARSDPQAYDAEQGLGGILAGVAAQPPLVLSKILTFSARFHTDEMATNNYFAHQSAVTGDFPNKMARDAGYDLPAGYLDTVNNIESLAAGTSTADATLRLLIEDSGVVPPGHREHLLAIDPFWQTHREVGVGYSYNASATYDYYWAIHTAVTSTGGTFLTGVVYNDANGNSRYDQGEGLSGVTVSKGSSSTTTSTAGGWTLPVTNGAYTVTASGGAFSGTASASVTVAGSNVQVDFVSGRSTGIVNFVAGPPVAVISQNGPKQTYENVTFSGAGSIQGDAPIVSWDWDLDNDGQYDDASGETGITHQWTDEGACVVRLKVTDDDGLTGTASATVTITNRAPTALGQVNATSREVGESVACTDNGSHDNPIATPDGTVAKWTWDFGDGATAAAFSSATTVYHHWTAEGSYVVKLTVRDDDGASSSVVTIATVTVAGTTDADLDGIPDAWESDWISGGDADPAADDDGDGLSNLDEYENHTDPTVSDTDGDGSGDSKEVSSGSNPLDPDSVPKKSSKGGGGCSGGAASGGPAGWAASLLALAAALAAMRGRGAGRAAGAGAAADD